MRPLLKLISRGNRFFTPSMSMRRNITQVISFDQKKAILLDQTWLMQQYYLGIGYEKPPYRKQETGPIVKVLDAVFASIKESNSPEDLKQAFEDYTPLYRKKRLLRSVWALRKAAS